MKKKYKILIAVLAVAVIIGCLAVRGVFSAEQCALMKMSDEELIQSILDNDDVMTYMVCSYRSPLGECATLRELSPAFNELMWRASGVQSLKEYEPQSDSENFDLEGLLKIVEN